LHDLQKLCSEVTTILDAEGLKLSFDLADRAAQICQSTALNISSMLQDVRAERETEIEYISGYICRLAAKNAVQANLNQQMYKLVKNLR